MKKTIELDFNKILKTIIKYLLLIVVIGGLSIFCAKKFTNYFDTPIIEYKSVITEKNVVDNTSFATTNQSTRATTKEIEKIRENPNSKSAQEKLVAELPPECSKKDIQKEVNKAKGDVALSEPSDNHIGTNIYSIKINKTKHAIGLYMGGAVQNAAKEKTSYGVHYRNGRMAYQVGRTFGHDFECRVIWEAIQW